MKIDKNKILMGMARGKFTIKSLSLSSGVSRVTLSNIKNGKINNLEPSTLGRIAEALKVDVSDLIIREESIISVK